VCATFITATGETDCSVSSSAVTVTDKTTNGQVTITFTTSGFPGVTGRNLYASKANTSTPLYLIVTTPVVANNSATTYVYNVADASLTATVAPTANTTNDARATILNTGATSFPGAVDVGSASPTAITNIRVYTPSLTPTQLAAAIGVVEQTFTVTGLTTNDKVLVVGPSPTALCPPVTYRVSAADTLAIGFADLTVALCTPTAGTYVVVAIRS